MWNLNGVSRNFQVLILSPFYNLARKSSFIIYLRKTGMTRSPQVGSQVLSEPNWSTHYSSTTQIRLIDPAAETWKLRSPPSTAMRVYLLYGPYRSTFIAPIFSSLIYPNTIICPFFLIGGNAVFDEISGNKSLINLLHYSTITNVMIFHFSGN